MNSTGRCVPGFIIAQTAGGSAPAAQETFRYSAVSDVSSGIAARLTDATPQRLWPATTIVSPAKVGDPCQIYVLPGQAPQLLVLTEICDPALCGQAAQ